jgi:hypothetical protein
VAYCRSAFVGPEGVASLQWTSAHSWIPARPARRSRAKRRRRISDLVSRTSRGTRQPLGPSSGEVTPSGLFCAVAGGDRHCSDLPGCLVAEGSASEEFPRGRAGPFARGSNGDKFSWGLTGQTGGSPRQPISRQGCRRARPCLSLEVFPRASQVRDHPLVTFEGSQ